MNDNEFIIKIKTAEFIKGAVKADQFPEDNKPHVAFAGRSNVGKSSLQNVLLGRKKLVKVSATPGKTQEINFFLINEAFYFVDLPGVGYARAPGNKRKEMSASIIAYTTKCENLKGIVYLVDMRTSGTEVDLFSVEALRDLGIPILIIGTKKDKLNQKEYNKSLATIQKKFKLDEPLITTSSLKKQGLEDVWSSIMEVIAGAE